MIVRPAGFAAIEDRDECSDGERLAAWVAFAAEALDELIVVRVPLVQDLHRDLAAELLVFGQPDVRHPTRAELAFESVAAGEEGALSLVGRRHFW